MTLPTQDIVERLRDYGLTLEENIVICDRRVVDEAADTISRLTADNEALRAEVERVRDGNRYAILEQYAAARAEAAEFAQEVERLRETLRAVKQWTLFELRGNATRQPWRRRLEAIDAALGDRP